jgi:tellurite methyltransferase
MPEEPPPPAGVPPGASPWEERYRSGSRGAFFGEEPSTLARRLVHFFRMCGHPIRGDLLEIGCGEGRDVVYLAGLGFRVEAVEGAPTGAARTRDWLREARLDAQVREIDLARFAWTREYDVVFSNQAIQFAGREAPRVLDSIRAHTRPGGWNAIGMFTDQRIDREAHPELHVLEREELYRIYASWRLMEYGESIVYSPRRDAYLSFAQLIARKPE